MSEPENCFMGSSSAIPREFGTFSCMAVGGLGVSTVWIKWYFNKINQMAVLG